MTAGGFRKAGWHWTRKGWKRTPKRLQTVKKATKRRPFKKATITPAEGEKLPTFAAARKLAAEQGRADSAPTPAADPAKPATPPPRKAWSGKYDDLTPPRDSQGNPRLP